MDKFVVTGIPAFNGDYPVDISSFTMRELQIIKRMSGVRAGELSEAFSAGDTTLILAVAVIAVRRSGKNWEVFEQIAWESDLDCIAFVSEDEEAADKPDPLTQKNERDENAKPNEQTDFSMKPSSADGDDPQETNLRAIGSQP